MAFGLVVEPPPVLRSEDSANQVPQQEDREQIDARGYRACIHNAPKFGVCQGPTQPIALRVKLLTKAIYSIFEKLLRKSR